ncbi:hypothetical protein L484_006950 [Morus notabilis]|uniref:Uncharacterized protein n=1 Tax=Morus notabilis TaxID=981085 RepID=W9REJ3_9ROSA|nr:hypothetical protein L484_006950 [Morus notabilis]
MRIGFLLRDGVAVLFEEGVIGGGRRNSRFTGAMAFATTPPASSRPASSWPPPQPNRSGRLRVGFSSPWRRRVRSELGG